MKKITLSFFLLATVFVLTAQPKTEIRAVWLSTNYALDWPQTDKNANSQKEKLQTMLDQLKAININTIFFQIQCRSDVFWDSEYQPWSRHITGVANKEPSYDVLQFAIDECHKRGMEIHGWVIPYPQGSQAIAGIIGNQHSSKTRPDLSVLYEKSGVEESKWEWYLDPGLPETTEYLLNLYGEVIDKYDLDALHLDYTRYPDKDFPDAVSYAKYGGGKDKDQWRRDNINNFVHELYDLIKEKKPDMKLTAAPIGAYESLPEATSYFTARDHVFQDPVEWMSAGKLDMAVPQVYWKANYAEQLANWIKKSSDRPIVSGMAAYKMLPPKDGEDWEATVITGQIDKARELNAAGLCFFRTAQITDNYKGVYTLLKEGQFKYPSNLPPAKWLEETQPATPQQVKITRKSDDTYNISWQKEDDAKYYCVYAGNTQTIDISDVKNLVAHYVTGNTAEYTVPDPDKNYYFTVTAFDKGYHESETSSVVSTNQTTGLFGIPNPGTVFSQYADMLDISSEIAIKSVQIYSINGSLLNSEAYNDLHLTIETSSYPQGVYVVIATLEDGSNAKHKFIR